MKIITIVNDITTNIGEHLQIEYPTIDKYLEDGWGVTDKQVTMSESRLAVTFTLTPPSRSSKVKARI
ncbi:MAG: hypothetical protein ACO1N0_02770 [Fluviicola sp.]